MELETEYKIEQENKMIAYIDAEIIKTRSTAP